MTATTVLTPTSKRFGVTMNPMWIGGALFSLVALYLILGGIARPDQIAKIYAGDVIVILICLDLLTKFFSDLGALDAAALWVARATRGDPRRMVWGIGLLIFFISAVLNNLAAVFAAAPIFLLILRQLGAGPKATALVLALILVNTNLGGAATPIGDFPAIILMASGVISFNSYLTLAFPLCIVSAIIVTAIAAVMVPAMWSNATPERAAIGRFAVEALGQGQRFVHRDWARIVLLAATFGVMIVVWAVVSPAYWPFHYTALAGAVAACMIMGPHATKAALATYDLKTTTYMAITLAAAAICAATGALEWLANFLSTNVTNPVALLFVVMLVTTAAAGLFQAGPAAAAMLPVVAALTAGALRPYGDWVYVAFAGAICAGSSMFVWSATSGPALSGEATKAGIKWGVPEYLRYGGIAAVVQFAIVAMWVSYAVVPGVSFWTPLVALFLMIGGLVGLLTGRVLANRSKIEADEKKRGALHSLGANIMMISVVVEIIAIVTKLATWLW